MKSIVTGKDVIDNIGQTLTKSLSIQPYFYDGDGLRVSRTNNLALPPKTTYYVWDTENPTGYPQVLEEIENNQVVRRYGYGLFLETIDIKNGANLDRFYVIRDGTNSVRMLLDSTGNVSAQYDYDVFGNVLSSTLTNPICSQNPYQFHSEYRDPATGLVYLRARWYEPREGRFVGMDEFDGKKSNPLSNNKYIFTVNNPINLTDPSGNFYILIAPGITVEGISGERISSLLKGNLNRGDPDNIKFPPLPGEFLLIDLKLRKNTLETIKENVVLTLKEKAENRIEALNKWRKRVTPYNEWDYKYQWAERQGYKIGYPIYELCADFGNFNYGVTGRAVGSFSLLLRMIGGLEEFNKDLLGDSQNYNLPPSWGDEPDDTYYIKRGVDYWTTLNELNSELR